MVHAAQHTKINNFVKKNTNLNCFEMNLLSKVYEKCVVVLLTMSIIVAITTLFVLPGKKKIL